MAWKRNVGRGRVCAYYGPVDLRQKEDVWTTAYNIPVRFLKDGLRECIRDGILTKTPFSLNIEAKDVYLVETEDGFMGLNEQ